jgi:hypothetical protein
MQAEWVNAQKPMAGLVRRKKWNVDIGGFPSLRFSDSLGTWQPRRAFPIWPPVPQMSCGRW